MRALVMALVVGACAPAIAQDFPAMPAPKCSMPFAQDRFSVEPEGEWAAVFSYYNNVERCSDEIEGSIMERGKPWAFKLRVVVGQGKGDDRERVYVDPVDPLYIATPPDVTLLDGETGTIWIGPGVF